MSSKAAAYREMVEDVIAGGLLEEDEIEELRDLIARVDRHVRANLPATTPDEVAAE